MRLFLYIYPSVDQNELSISPRVVGWHQFIQRYVVGHTEETAKAITPRSACHHFPEHSAHKHRRGTPLYDVDTISAR
jgi:hypothetical protein